MKRAIFLLLVVLHSVIANAQDNVATADRAMVALGVGLAATNWPAPQVRTVLQLPWLVWSWYLVMPSQAAQVRSRTDVNWTDTYVPAPQLRGVLQVVDRWDTAS